MTLKTLVLARQAGTMTEDEILNRLKWTWDFVKGTDYASTFRERIALLQIAGALRSWTLYYMDQGHTKLPEMRPKREDDEYKGRSQADKALLKQRKEQHQSTTTDYALNLLYN